MEAEPRPPPAVLTATEVILAVLLGGLAAASIGLCNALVWRPRRLRSRLQKQGVEGPPPTLFVGNIPDMKRFQKEVAAATAQWNPPSSSLSDKDHSLCHAWPSTIFPFLDHWRNQYGPMFMYSMGSIQLLCVLDVKVVKELSLCTSLSLGKPSYLSKDRGPLLGEGILSSSGSIWAHHRKIIAPELYLDKVKGMVNLMVDSTNLLLKSWERRVQSEGDGVEISIDDDLRSLSADIISRACFGSNYTQGEEIFLKLRQLQKVMSKGNIGVPGSRYLPTKDNREIWKLEKAIRDMILEVVMQRQEQGSCEEDLLQMLLAAAKDGGGAGGGNEGLPPNMSRDKFIVDNCKNIYFAGHETTAITALWALMLLAAYPEWQDRAREEVVGVVGDDNEGVLDYDKLRSMKMLNMIIQETLRLYPPAAFVVRSALEEIKFKEMVVPKGFDIQVPISLLHLDPDMWGADASKFNPERFSQGISGASNSIHAYLPFGLGPRACAGQHFAMVELKVILSLILSKFSFSLSPKYKHAPSFRLVIEPGSGVQLCVSKL